CQQHNDYPWTF
nr:immunoglobulin light chain junction region [Macaca mulatta]